MSAKTTNSLDLNTDRRYPRLIAAANENFVVYWTNALILPTGALSFLVGTIHPAILRFLVHPLFQHWRYVDDLRLTAVGVIRPNCAHQAHCAR